MIQPLTAKQKEIRRLLKASRRLFAKILANAAKLRELRKEE